ncbi:hypothetical protein C8T65DRAFT_698208 [Cerioporus squamosus]|nr:hypothetical protein C8T65DRAFT_698208 [Cerioporus squamosus]
MSRRVTQLAWTVTWLASLDHRLPPSQQVAYLPRHTLLRLRLPGIAYSVMTCARLKTRSSSQLSSIPETRSKSPTSYSPAGAYRCATRESLLEKREKLLKRKKVPSPQHELFKMLASINDTQPVNTLPRELLIYVIEYLCPSSDALNTEHWIGQLYVCRRWYEIVTSMPSFWRRIYVSSHPEWLKLCLSRCAGMPADIYFTGRFSRQATIPIIEEHEHLIRAMTYSVRRSSWASDVAQLLTVPLSALEKVDVSLKTKSERLALVDLPQESYAHLQSLCLRSCGTPRNCGTYTSLRMLRLVHSSWSISFSQFLDILLTAVRSSLGLQILAHIRVPKATHINIVCMYANSHYPQPSVWGLLPQNAASFSPIFSTTTSVTVGFPDWQCCEVAAQSGTCRLSMQVHLRGSTRFSDTWQAREGLVKMFTDAPVSSLTVSNEAQLVSGATWEHIFRSLPTLKHLDLRDRGYIDSLSAALQSASEHGGGIMCCPDISTVCLLDSSCAHDGHHPIPTATLGTLRVQAERGTRLEKLQICSLYPYGHTKAVSKKFLATLKSLVPTVQFKLTCY